jgi:hypothetical protein
MASTWSSELGKFLDTLRDALVALIEAMGEKAAALRDLDEAKVVALVTREEQLVAQLKGLLAVREQVLKGATQRGWQVDSLQSLVQKLPIVEQEPLLPRLDRVRELSLKLRHVSWAHWVLVHRASQHAEDLFDLVAHGGHSPATYEDNITPLTRPVSPAILDAAA